ALQRRYVLEQDKTQVERRIQQKRHALELEQRSLQDRQKDFEQKQATMSTQQRQMEDLGRRRLEVEQQEQRLDQVRNEGVALRVQLEDSIPQTLTSLEKEVREHQEKR